VRRNGPGRLAGKVALITGGTRGIGAAVARSFLLEGAKVLLVARQRDAGLRMVEELGGDGARFVPGDVADEETAVRAVAAASDAFGALHVLVNNAALDFSKAIDETTADEARRILDVNFLGAFLMLREGGRLMREAGRGSIVNVVSRYALVGGPGMGVYSAAKGALLSLTRTAAIEWAPWGVRVNAVAPGPTDTPLLQEWIGQQPDPSAFTSQLATTVPLGRLGAPEDVAAAIVFLASDESRQVTGACLSVDGGYTAA
jgi:NAD(P)-dependent dehydrogenase (short-subunit alcohol dehydrogenase family)